MKPCGSGRASSARPSNQIRRRLPCPSDKWHLDEVCLMIRGTKHWLWRAVDQDGVVLDVLVQSRRDKRAAKRLLRKLLKRQTRMPRVMITDKLASYRAAKGEVMASVEHRRHKGLYGDIDVKVRVQRQRSSGFVGRNDGYELIRGELAIGRGSSRRELVFGRSTGARPRCSHAHR